MVHYGKYSHLSNKRRGWNKHGGGAKNAKSPNVEGEETCRVCLKVLNGTKLVLTAP